jgi:hypothetical protein
VAILAEFGHHDQSSRVLITWDIIWSQDIKELGFGIHQKVLQSCKTLEKSTESQTWSTVHLIRDLVMGFDLRGLIHAYTSFIYHVKHPQ